jgi:hypothetical protein
MKKSFLIIGFFLIVSGILSAQTAQTMVITRIDGTTIQIPLIEIKSITFTEVLPGARSSGATVKPAVKDTYAIGETGPAGGIVFYDKGSYSDGWRFIEAAPAAAEGKDKLKEGANEFFFFETAAEIGAAKDNTSKIVQRQDAVGYTADKQGFAAAYCYELVYGGYDDWYLPTIEELVLMLTNLHQKGLGGFLDYYYWTSSDYDGWNEWYVNFETGTQYVISRDYELHVRPVRYF